MAQCPQCQKSLGELTRRCPSCQADLDLLVDYVSYLRGGLERAQELTKAGELSQAVWAYLEVLEIDPDNAVAKKQVAKVATAVRQFDLAAVERQWLSRNGSQNKSNKPLANRLVYLCLAALVLAAFTIGYVLGSAANYPEADPTDRPPLKAKDNNSLLG
jgi:hypothetical protein